MSGKTLIFSKSFLKDKLIKQPIFFGRSSEFFYIENFNSIGEKEKAHQFCHQTFSAIFSDLIKSLNELHNVNFSSRSWSIILGPWLRVFINTVYENYTVLEKVLKDKNITEVYSYNPEDYKLYTNDGWTLEIAITDENWNSALNSKILKFLNINKKTTYKKNNKNCFHPNERPNSKKHILFKVINLFKKFLCFFKKDNYACIYNSCLPFLYEKKLELKIGQIPQLWDFEKKIIFRDFDKSLRKHLNLNQKKSSGKFEEFLRMILPSSLPIYVLESFKDINELSDKSNFPKNPSFIFTSDAFNYHEVFKFYTAKKVQNGVPYYLGQHGNSYSTHVYNNFTTEMSDCDKFISWGLKGNEKTIESINFKILGKKRYFNKDGKLLAIFDGLHCSGMPVLDLVAKEKNNFESAINILDNFPKKIKTKTLIRLSWLNNHNFNTPYKSIVEKLKINIDDGVKPFRPLLKNTRLTFFNYDSTGILENLALNIPTVCYWHNTFGYINPKFVDTYKLLVEANILFTKPNNLVQHIERNWDDINSWWMNEKTQKLINDFNSKINKPPKKDSLNSLKEILTQKEVYG